jgi:hypothetical protein
VLTLIAAAVVSATLVLLFAAGGGGASASPNAPKDNSLPASVLKGMNTNLVSVTVGPPPSDYPSAEGSTWLYVTHDAGQTPADNAQDAWYTYLIAGAYGAQCADQGADCLAGYSFTGADGQGEDDGVGRLVMRSMPVASGTQAELSASIEAGFGAQGIRTSSIAFEQPYGLAPVVEIRSEAPQKTVDSLNSGIVFQGLGIDGFLVRIVDSTGKTVYVDDAAERAQAGQAWVAPSLNVPNTP